MVHPTSKLLSWVSKIFEISCEVLGKKNKKEKKKHNPTSDTVPCVPFYKEIGCLLNTGNLTNSLNKHF